MKTFRMPIRASCRHFASTHVTVSSGENFGNDIDGSGRIGCSIKRLAATSAFGYQLGSILSSSSGSARCLAAARNSPRICCRRMCNQVGTFLVCLTKPGFMVGFFLPIPGAELVQRQKILRRRHISRISSFSTRTNPRFGICACRSQPQISTVYLHCAHAYFPIGLLSALMPLEFLLD